MKFKNILYLLAMMGVGTSAPFVQLKAADPSDFIVYSIYNALYMGNPGEKPARDYYVNMGTQHGLKKGGKVEVLRRRASYDLLTKTLHKEVTFPIARLKVIHAEGNVAVCRLEEIFGDTKTPVIVPRAVMIGDLVRPVK